MFSDRRSRRVIFLAHCILNQNAISDGTAGYPAAHREVVQALLDAQVGVVQMPCPELCCLGLDRGDPQGGERPVVVENTRIRAAMCQPRPRERLERLVESVLYQVGQYRQHGFDIVGIVGVDRSPTCGVNTTSDQDRELEGQGEFIRAIQTGLSARGLSIPVVGIRCDREAAERVRSIL